MARLAGLAHGVVTRQQLLRADISDDEIKHRLAIGGLMREYPGVYRVGHRALSAEARYMAAVLACGEGAVLGGPAAARLLGLLKGEWPPPEVVTRVRRRVCGVRTRRSRRVEATTWLGIP
jgi:hypothetical protein